MPPSGTCSFRRNAHGRCRRCLLKGCEQSFRPRRPQSRYCSDRCRQLARRWRRWQASRRWRGTDQGRACRRRQGQRYRQRRQERVASVRPPPSIDEEPPLNAVMTSAAQRTDDPGGREGQRPATISEDFDGHFCQRPGCYVYFALQARSPGQRFCSAQCRRALRRVLDREAKWRRRRGRRFVGRGGHRRDSPRLG